MIVPEDIWMNHCQSLILHKKQEEEQHKKLEDLVKCMTNSHMHDTVLQLEAEVCAKNMLINLLTQQMEESKDKYDKQDYMLRLALNGLNYCARMNANDVTLSIIIKTIEEFPTRDVVVCEATPKLERVQGWTKDHLAVLSLDRELPPVGTKYYIRAAL